MNTLNEVTVIVVSADLFISGIKIHNQTTVNKNRADEGLRFVRDGGVAGFYLAGGNQAKTIWMALRELYVKRSTFTSEYWHMVYHANLIILDPDGWDRKDYDFSFKSERITHDEFLKRLWGSTVIGR